MKFTIAASILSQTFPVLSERSWSNTNRGTPPKSQHDDSNLAGFLAALKKDQTTTQRFQKRTGKNTFGDTFQTHPPPSATLLTKNSPLLLSSSTEPAKTACDPSSSSKDDADIGILSCGLGYECVLVDADASSSLGGICMPSVTSPRHLQSNEQCALCSFDFGMTVGKEFYETVIDDAASGFQGKTCGDMVTVAYMDRTIDAATCPVAAQAVQAAGCCAPVCDLCGRTSQMDYSNANLVVDVPIDGYDGVTCGSNAPTPNGLVGASYFYATIDPANCPTIRQAALDSGCCVQTLCYTCGFGLSNITDDYNDGTVCADLKVAAYYNRTIVEEDCPAAVQLALEEGCCSVAPTYDYGDDCNICGVDTTFYPDNWVFKAGTCDYVRSQLNPSRCEQFSPDLSPMCCSPAPAPFFSIPSSPTTDEEDDKTPGGSPTSSSVPLWSTSTPWSLVSMMGLTTLAGACLLN